MGVDFTQEMVLLREEVDRLSYTIGVCCANMLNKLSRLEQLTDTDGPAVLSQILTRLKVEHPEYAGFYDSLFSRDVSSYVGGNDEC